MNIVSGRQMWYRSSIQRSDLKAWLSRARSLSRTAKAGASRAARRGATLLTAFISSGSASMVRFSSSTSAAFTCRPTTHGVRAKKAQRSQVLPTGAAQQHARRMLD